MPLDTRTFGAKDVSGAAADPANGRGDSNHEGNGIAVKSFSRGKTCTALCAGFMVLTSVSLVAVTGGSAVAAKGTPLSVTCPGTGTATASPGIPATGKPVKQTVTFAGIDTSCTSSTGTGPTSGTWSGTVKTGKLNCASLLSGFTAKGSYSEEWGNGLTSTVKMNLTFPPTTSTSDTGTYTGKVTGTLGKGTGSGTVVYSLTNPTECTSGSAVSIHITNTNTVTVNSK